MTTQELLDRNSTILKRFFRRPIVIVLGGLLCATVVISFIASMLPGSSWGVLIYSTLSVLPFDLPNELVTLVANPALNAPSVDLLTLFSGVTFVLFFFFARSRKVSLTAPSIMFLIFSIICLVISCITALAVIAGTIGLITLLGQAGTFVNDLGANINVAGYLVAGAIIIGLYLVLYLLFPIMQLRFALSIRKSIKNPELACGGATFFGILKIIASAVSLLSISTIVLISARYNPNVALGIINQVVMCGAGIVFGIVAIMYANHIKKYPTNIFPDDAGYNEYGDSYDSVDHVVDTTDDEPVETYQDAPMPEKKADEWNPNEKTQTFDKVKEVEEVKPVKENKAVVNNVLNTCRVCGKPLADGHKFCKNCGTKVD